MVIFLDLCVTIYRNLWPGQTRTNRTPMGSLDKKRHRMLVINVRRLYEAMCLFRSILMLQLFARRTKKKTLSILVKKFQFQEDLKNTPPRYKCYRHKNVRPIIIVGWDQLPNVSLNLYPHNFFLQKENIKLKKKLHSQAEPILSRV